MSESASATDFRDFITQLSSFYCGFVKLFRQSVFNC